MTETEYYASPEWSKLRSTVFERDKNTCQDCGRAWIKGLVAHHTTYQNFGAANDREIEDCVCLCRKCHNARHRYGAGHPHYVATPEGNKKATGLTTSELLAWVDGIDFTIYDSSGQYSAATFMAIFKNHIASTWQHIADFLGVSMDHYLNTYITKEVIHEQLVIIASQALAYWGVVEGIKCSAHIGADGWYQNIVPDYEWLENESKAL